MTPTISGPPGMVETMISEVLVSSEPLEESLLALQGSANNDATHIPICVAWLMYLTVHPGMLTKTLALPGMLPVSN